MIRNHPIYDYAVKKTVEPGLLAVLQHVVDPTRLGGLWLISIRPHAASRQAGLEGLLSGRSGSGLGGKAR